MICRGVCSRRPGGVADVHPSTHLVLEERAEVQETQLAGPRGGQQAGIRLRRTPRGF